MLRLGTLLLALLLTQACAKKLEPQETCNFVMNSEQQRVSWKDATPINLYVHESFPTQYVAALQNAIRHWDVTTGRSLIRYVGVTRGSTVPVRDGFSALYWMNNWESDRRSEQARTTIYWEGSRIVEADVRVNTRDFTYSTGDYPSSNSVDLESLLVHELGHVLGLQHNDSQGSVMAVQLANAMFRRTPQPVDLASLKCEY